MLRLHSDVEPEAKANQKNVCYSFKLSEGENYIGRDPPRRADVFSVIIGGPNAAFISRHHATITKAGNTFMLTFLGQNGGLVNSIKTASGVLNDGDIITFGGVNPK